MSEAQTLAAETRARTGTGGARAVRRDGKVPGIVYGDGKDAVAVKVDPIDLLKAYRQEGFMSQVLNLEIDGKAEQAIPRDVQTHPVKDHIMHVDFMRVSAKTKVTVSVPMHFTNEDQSPGLGRGGVLNIVRHDVEIRCPASAIPEYLVGDLTGLDINDAIKISNIDLPDGAKATITDRDFTIATVAAPSLVRSEAEEEAEAAEGEDGEAPEEGETEAAPAGDSDE